MQIAKAPITRRAFSLLAVGLLPAVMAGCTPSPHTDEPSAPSTPTGSSHHLAPEVPAAKGFGSHPRALDGFTLIEGSQVDRGFIVDNVLEAPSGRTLHFCLHVPDSYDGTRPFALYVACPGWEGLYFQGVGANLQEDYPFVANTYVPDMIVASAQLDGWDEQSGEDVIELTQWLLQAFNIDAGRVYLSGCSGGGETISYVLGMHPEVFRRALHTISRWDGDIDVLADAEVPVYMAIGERDDYYGPEPAREAYKQMVSAYRERGLSDERIGELVVLDVKPTSYFTGHGFAENASQHGAGGYLFAHDEQIMGWLFR